MRLHTNPKTGAIMSINLNSPEMPNFLRPSHGQMFEFVAKPRAETRKKFLLPTRNPTLDMLNPASVGASHPSFYRLNDNSLSQSFGQSSVTVKRMLRDEVPDLRMSRGLYNNKIFGVRKQVLVPEDSSLVLKTEQKMDLCRSYSKPSELSKLQGDLNFSKVLMRQKPPTSPRTVNNSRLVQSAVRTTSTYSKLRLSKRPGLSITSTDLQKTSKIRSTIDDYKRLYSKQDELDPQTFQNTMNHILAYQTILGKVKKPTRPKRYIRLG